MRVPRPFRALLAVAAGVVLAGAGIPPAPDQADAPQPSDTPPVVALDASGAGVDDFEFASFDAVYELGRTDDGRSRLHTTETLVAVFPDIDQNRGILRALVPDYQGHSTSIDVLSVTDETGAPRAYERGYDDDGFLTLTIAVPRGQFVHGEQTYVIEYTQTDVTLPRVTDSADGVTTDEFFWDVNGIGWRQPFAEVSATVIVDPAIRGALTGDAQCYWGYKGTSDSCDIRATADGFAASVSDLLPYQNMTVVVRFEPGTFAGAPFWQYVPWWTILALVLLVFGLGAALVTRFVLWRDAPGRGIVVAQYEPAEGMTALLAANIVDRQKKGMAATIVDLAVRKNVRILERDQGFRSVFGVQKLTDAGLAPDEQRVMDALFAVSPFARGITLPGILNLARSGGPTPEPAADPGPGEVRWLTKGDTVLGQQVVALTKATDKEVETGGLRRKPSRLPLLLVVGSIVLAALLLFLPTVASGGGGRTVGIGVAGLILLPWILIFSVGALLRRRPLTTKGSELKEHLEGLREFIRVAEADRLQMLQSVSGAERVTTTDGAQIVKIYERLLPYAVLFGLEKEWAREIGKYYDTTPPDWYSGSSGFAVGAFASGISSLSSSVSTSYSGSSGSSSSGGGGGGGSSGGGGGGGGGGGV